MYRRAANHYSLDRPEDLLFLSVGSALGIGNLIVLPYLMARYGVLSVLLTHTSILFLVVIPIVISELLWGRWLLRSVRESLQLVPRFGKLFMAFLILLWVDLTPNYIVEYSKAMIHLLRRDWVLSPDQFVAHLNRQSVSDSLQIYFLSCVFVFGVTVLASLRKVYLARIFKWILLSVAVISILLFSFLLPNMDWSTMLKQLRFIDFSRFGIDALIQITTYTMFSMSVGMGIYFTFVFYASQKPIETVPNHKSFWSVSGALPKLAVRILVLDLIFSFLSVLLLLPHLNADGNFVGTPLAIANVEYISLYLFPLFLSSSGHFPDGMVSLYVALFMGAGLMAMLSLVDVAFWSIDRELKFRRRWKILLLCFLLSLFISAPLLPFLKDLLSDFGSGYLLPISGLIWCVCGGWVMPRRAQLMLMGRGPRLDGFFILWRFTIRWLVPFVLLFMLILQVSKAFHL